MSVLWIGLVSIGLSLIVPSSLSAADLTKTSAVKVSERVGIARVRVRLKVTPFEKIVTRSPLGAQSFAYKPGREIIHTLRARIDRPNHFYFGEWHVTSTPLAWQKEARHYRVRLNFQKIYGSAANLEESIGDLEVSGTLQPAEKGVFNLIAADRMLFRDLEGNPKLKIAAGFLGSEQPEQPGVAATAREAGSSVPR